MPALGWRKSPQKPCEQCGNTTAPPGLKWVAGRRFCSRACYDANRANAITKTCIGCNKPFTITKGSIAYRYNFCSWACKQQHVDKRDMCCERCQKQFRQTKQKGKWPKHAYCSEECRRPPHIFTCKQCGTTFRSQPSTDPRFCSLSCYRRFKGETRIETIVRIALDNLRIPFQQETRFSRYSIDFALPKLIAIEVDGTYWHRDRSRTQKKDRTLKAAGWRVIRINEAEINNAADISKLIVSKLKTIPGLQLSRLRKAKSFAPHRVVRSAYKGRMVANYEKQFAKVLPSYTPRHYTKTKSRKNTISATN